MKNLLGFTAAVLILSTGCSNNVASPGNDIRSALPEKSHTIIDAWPEAGQVLFAEGCPVQLDTYTAVHSVSGNGILTIDVRSHDFDPVAALIDGDGNLIAFNDNWKLSANARLVVQDIPSGAELLVFSPDDSRGLYDVLVKEGTANDLEVYQEASDFSDGTVTGWIDDNRFDSYLDRILRESLQDDVYVTNYPQARLYPFSIDSSGLASLLLESDDFDPYLVLMEAYDGAYSFIEANDDYSGSNSRIVRELEAGNYIALVMPYSTGNSGRFSLELEILGEEVLQIQEVQALEPGTDYTSEIVENRNFAMGWWPEMRDNYEVPGFLSPLSPVAGFVFTIENAMVYEVNASGDMDVCLTLLRRNEDNNIEFVSSNDDYGDLGSNSRIVQPLLPGEYIALVSQYSGSSGCEVTFSYSETEETINTLRSGRAVSEYLSYDIESLLFQMSLQEGYSYSISVESDELDPIITLILADGHQLSDDDGGSGTNSLLNFTVNSGQGGDCFLIVEKYSGGEGTFTLILEETGR